MGWELKLGVKLNTRKRTNERTNERMQQRYEKTLAGDTWTRKAEKLLQLLGALFGKVEAIDRSNPLLGKNQPPGNVHQEHRRGRDGELLANVHRRLVPGHAHLGTNRHTHPPVAKDPAPKVGDKQQGVDKPLELRIDKGAATALEDPAKVQDGGTHVHEREHTDEVWAGVVDGESVEIIGGTKDDRDMVEEDEVAADAKGRPLIELKGGVLGEVAELETDEEGSDGGRVGGDVVLGPVDCQQEVEASAGHDGGMDRGHHLVAEMILLLSV